MKLKLGKRAEIYGDLEGIATAIFTNVNMLVHDYVWSNTWSSSSTRSYIEDTLAEYYEA